MPIKKRTQAATATTNATETTAAAPIAEAVEAPVRKRRTRKSAAVEVAPEPVTPEPVAPEPVEEQQSLDLTHAKAGVLAMPVNLPALDAPAINPNEPALSYKIDFSCKESWFVSADGGATKESIDSAVIAGAPIDLALQISKAKKGRPGFDQRLRLAFYQPSLDGEPTLAELNINAVNTDRDGNLYVTSSARSLVGALLAISDSEDDIEAFCNGARFRLRPGTGKGIFVEVDVACGDRWVAMANPANTNRVSKEAHGFHNQLALIKSRFRNCGHLLSACAVIGELEDYDAEQRDHDFVEVPVVPQS
jgi:hypothetical protein